jgi:hypothetical protein
MAAVEQVGIDIDLISAFAFDPLNRIKHVIHPACRMLCGCLHKRVNCDFVRLTQRCEDVGSHNLIVAAFMAFFAKYFVCE